MVEEKVIFSSSRCTDVVKRELLQSCNEAFNGHQGRDTDLSSHLHEYGRHRSKMTAVHGSESLSDIDDAELCRYFNSREEMRCKKILWEKINCEHKKVRHAKPVGEVNKAGPIKKAPKFAAKAERKKVKAENKKRSSKINYDALQKLNAELEGSPEKVNNESTSPGSNNHNLQLNVKLIAEGHESERRDYDDELCHGNEYGENDQSKHDDSSHYFGDEDDEHQYDEDYPEDD